SVWDRRKARNGEEDRGTVHQTPNVVDCIRWQRSWHNNICPDRDEVCVERDEDGNRHGACASRTTHLFFECFGGSAVLGGDFDWSAGAAGLAGRWMVVSSLDT